MKFIQYLAWIRLHFRFYFPFQLDSDVIEHYCSRLLSSAVDDYESTKWCSRDENKMEIDYDFHMVSVLQLLFEKVNISITCFLYFGFRVRVFLTLTETVELNDRDCWKRKWQTAPKEIQISACILGTFQNFKMQCILNHHLGNVISTSTYDQQVCNIIEKPQTSNLGVTSVGVSRSRYYSPGL